MSELPTTEIVMAGLKYGAGVFIMAALFLWMFLPTKSGRRFEKNGAIPLRDDVRGE